MRYYWDGDLLLARVHCDENASGDVFLDAVSEWWQAKSGEWKQIPGASVQVEVLGPSSYLERIDAAQVESAQSAIKREMG